MDQIRQDRHSNLKNWIVQNRSRLFLSSTSSSSSRPSSSALSPSRSVPLRSSRLPVRATSSPRPSSSALSPSRSVPLQSPRSSLSSTSSSSCPSSAALSRSRSVPLQPSTSASTSTDITKSSRPEAQIVQHASNPSSNIRLQGESQPPRVSAVARTGKQLDAVQDSSKSVKEEEKRNPDDAQKESETKIKELEKKVEDLTSKLEEKKSELRTADMQYIQLEMRAKVRESELEETKSKLQTANQEWNRILQSNLYLRERINERASELTNLLKKQAFRQDIFEEWQNDNQPVGDAETNGELIDRLGGAYTIMMDDYSLIRAKFTQLEDENRTLQQAAAEREAREEIAGRRIAQLEDENRTLKQAASEREAREEAARQQITQLENENRTLQQAAADREAREEAARDRAAEFQARKGALTRENHTLRRQVENLRNRRNELQQQNNNLEAQRRGEVCGLLLAILITRQVLGNVLIYQCNEMRRRQNIALRRANQMCRRNERLALLLYQMTKPCERADSPPEIDPAPLPEADPPAVSETPEDDWRRRFDQYPQPKTRHSLRSVRSSRKKKMGVRENPYFETRTRGGPWQQPNASRYAQQYPDSKVGRDVRLAQFTST